MDQPEIAQKLPYVMDVEPGRYAWCRCGRSKGQPYCDGSHGGTPFTPLVETFEESKRVAWCGCKRTGSPPFCDGSHADL